MIVKDRGPQKTVKTLGKEVDFSSPDFSDKLTGAINSKHSLELRALNLMISTYKKLRDKVYLSMKESLIEKAIVLGEMRRYIDVLKKLKMYENNSEELLDEQLSEEETLAVKFLMRSPLAKNLNLLAMLEIKIEKIFAVKIN